MTEATRNLLMERIDHLKKSIEEAQRQRIWNNVRQFLKDPIKWVVDKAWPIEPWREGLSPYKWEIVFFLGFLMIAEGLCYNSWWNMMSVAFGAGILLGWMVNHRLEENRDGGWGWRKR